MPDLDLLTQASQRIVGSQKRTETFPYGPWKGSMRSRPTDQVPREFVVNNTPLTLATLGNSRNFLYSPRDGYWRRRGGQVIKFDTITSGHATTGLLPGAWLASPSATSVGAKARWMEEYDGPINTDGIPSVMSLATRETLASSCLDDGRFSNLWVRDQVNNANYTVGSEYSATTYPLPGSPQSLKFIPLWSDSGDGLITRGASDNYNATRAEFAQRFFFSGSRRFQKIGNWWYHPSVLGTPSRWIGDKAGDSVGTSLPSSSLVGGGNFQDWGTNGAFGGVAWQCIETNDGATSYIRNHQDIGTFVSDFGLTNGPLSTAINVWTVTFIARYNPTLTSILAGSVLQFGIVRSNGNRKVSPDFDASTLTNVFATYTATVTFDGTGETTGNTANSLRITNVVPPGSNGDKYIEVTSISVAPAGGQVGFRSNRLAPSGPWPPTHAGTLVKGTAIAGAAASDFERPDADITDNTWLNESGSNVNLYQSIDEVAASDTDFINTSTTGSVCEIGLSNFASTPASTHIVTLRVRAGNPLLVGTISLLVELYDTTGPTTRASATFTVTPGKQSFTYRLTAAEITAAAGGGGWNALALRFTPTIAGGANVRVYHAALEDALPGAAEGAWKGADRFAFSVAYRFEDDSVWMPCIPRFPNSILADGFNIFTVDSSNTGVFYDKLTVTLPIGPKGTKSRLYLRTPKIDSVTSDVRQINIYDLRIVAEIKDNTTTSYEDFLSNDESLLIDPGRGTNAFDGFFIRFDHIMPPRARYIFSGDMRTCHSYGGLNPAAITIAPVGRTADYDLNFPDDTSALYNQSSMYIRLTLSSAGVAALTLNKSDGTTLTTTSLALATYDTLEKLVDAINATSIAATSQQWRAQLCPGVNPAANSTNSLLPNFRTIDSCVVSGQTITKAAGGLAKVAVGNHVSGTGVTRGAYISRIDSDTQLTFVGTITAATKTLNFYSELGDDPLSVGAPGTVFGYQRVIANSLPGFIYFNNTYLGAFPIEKQSTWMTTASPGSTKSAPNCFSGKLSNKFVPPSAHAGISLGGAAVDQGFVIGFAQKKGAIRNARDTGSGLDEDYRLQMFSDSSGCIGPVVPGNRCAFMPTQEGISACDLFNEFPIGGAIFVHAPNARGDFTYEHPLAIAASGKDDDTGYFHLRVMRSALWVAFRSAAAPARPDQLICYDFSSGRNSGLEQLVRPQDDPLWPGELWGWSTPLAHLVPVTAMTEGRRSDGVHLYGWNEANGGTGDGRLEELEITNQDESTDITAEVCTPWEPKAWETQDFISGQEILMDHGSPAGSTGFLDFHRSLSDTEVASLTPATSAQVVVSELKEIPQRYRPVTRACYLGYRQVTGNARELRSLRLKAKMARRLKPGAA